MSVALRVLGSHGYTLLEATRRLRQIPVFRYVPIIAVTAYAMKGDKERGIDAGCNAYLSKPIDTRELPKIVTEMLLNAEPGKPQH